MKKGHYYVAITGILSGTIIFGAAVFAKMGLSLYEISVFRDMFALLLLPFLIYKKDVFLSKKMFKTYLLFGLIVALATFFEFAPVVLGVPVAITVLLLYTAPLWTVMFSKFLFKEEITKVKLLSMLLVLIGILILVNPMNLKESVSFIGLAAAMVGGIFLSLWGVFGKICGNEESHPVKTQFYETFFALVFLALFYPIVSYLVKDISLVSFSINHSPTIWAYLFGFSFISYIIPHFFYFKGIKEIPASTGGIILLLEPFAGAILAALFLSQPITINVIVGGLFIVAANYLVIKAEGDNAPLPVDGVV